MKISVAEAYQRLNENYDAVLKRLLGRENLVIKYLTMFLNDKNYEQLTAAVSANNAEDALKAAHTLKGMCFNLGLNTLGTICSQLVEAVRGGDYDLQSLYSNIKSEYENVIDVLNMCLDTD